MGDIVTFLVTDNQFDEANLPPRYPPQVVLGLNNHFLERLEMPHHFIQ